MTRLAPAFLVAAIALLAGGPAIAQSRWIDEAKLGVLYHDIGFGDHHVEPGADVNGELLFASPDFLRVIWAPRPHLGVSVNSAGATSYAYFGLTWSGEFSNFFVAGALGGAVHDGEISGERPDRKQLGSRILFHEYVELGYRVSAIVGVSLFLDHMSNADLARHNAGLTNLGLRVGYRF